MSDNIGFGKVDTQWSQYGLTQPRILFNGKPSIYKGICRDNQLIAIVGNRYHLLPNEEAVRIADQCASQIGLVPFDQFKGPWIIRMNGKHTVYNRKKTIVHALYALDKDFTVGGDKMYVGVGIHNSIDLSMGFGAGIFSFRQACSNVVLTAGMRGWSYFYSQADYGHTVKSVYMQHRSGLGKIKLQTIISNLMDKAVDIVKAYEWMQQKQVTDELIEKLKKSRIPKKLLPEYVTTEDEQAKAAMDWQSLTHWDTYNDITEQIWHNEKADLLGKTRQFAQLHRVMPLVVTQI